MFEQVKEYLARTYDVSLDPEKMGEKLQDLKTHLESTIVGQPLAIDAVVHHLSSYVAGINPPNRPLAGLLFVGPTGVGKSEVARSIAEHILGSADRLVEIDLSNYQERHERIAFTGAPPSYIGHETKPIFSQRALNEKCHPEIDDYFQKGLPHLTVILLNECDKAHPSVLKMLLGIFDTGELRLSDGTVTSFKETIFILTANWGSQEMASAKEGLGFVQGGHGNVDGIAERIARKALVPELINRLDGIVTFGTLSEDAVRELCTIELGKIQSRIRNSQTPFLFAVSQAAKNQLVKEGFSEAYNARELKRVIEKRVTRPLANLISSDQISGGSIVRIDYTDQWVFRKASVAIPFDLN